MQNIIQTPQRSHGEDK